MVAMSTQPELTRDEARRLAVTAQRLAGPRPQPNATGIMEKRRSRHRWIVLFTDGHPNDYDRYEGRYGQEDVRHAILEAEAQGIGIHLLSFDRARDVFGGYAESALNLARLPDHLLDFYSRIMGA